MNKNFIIKMIKAKKLEYEALKELMPDQMRERIETAEDVAKKEIKELLFEYMKEERNSKEEEDGEKNTSKAKKVKVEFE